MKRLLNIQEIARVLDCSPKTIKRMVDRGVIPAIQPGGPGTFIRFDFDAVMTELHKPSKRASSKSLHVHPSKTAGLSGPKPRWKKNQQPKQRND